MDGALLKNPPISDDWKNKLDEIFRDAHTLMGNCLNRNDEKFAPWYEHARKIVVQYAPQKLPTFDEIRFASDYFLSKNRDEQEEIDDRIALSSDIDLFQKMVSVIANDLRKKTRQFVKLEDLIHHKEETKPQITQEPVLVKWDPAQTPDALNQTRKIITSLSFSRRDEAEALQEVDRVEHELGKPRPDWDLIKRSIKFFLDFDRKLAQEAIPLILSLLPKQ